VDWFYVIVQYFPGRVVTMADNSVFWQARMMVGKVRERGCD
jgi:hypothetical protein